MVTFEYDGKIYKPSNLEKKLKKLGVTINDVKILDDTQTKTEKVKDNQVSLAYDPMLNIWWDSICVGWVTENLECINRGACKPFIPEPKDRYTYIGQTLESKFNDFTKAHWKEVLNIQKRKFQTF